MREVVVPLSALPESVSSFTVPDSAIAMGFLPRFDIPYERRPYHAQVFRMSQLSKVMREHGLPVGDTEDGYAGYHRRALEKYVEIQVWSDETPCRCHRS
ncbi:MAG: hypothetical protein FJ148_23880 [Deltaproteobacteria bacterium]|nr:hypothetical protein [Deltaproteobacteria bacterium]